MRERCHIIKKQTIALHGFLLLLITFLFGVLPTTTTNAAVGGAPPSGNPLASWGEEGTFLLAVFAPETIWSQSRLKTNVENALLNATVNLDPPVAREQMALTGAIGSCDQLCIFSIRTLSSAMIYLTSVHGLASLNASLSEISTMYSQYVYVYDAGIPAESGRWNATVDSTCNIAVGSSFCSLTVNFPLLPDGEGSNNHSMIGFGISSVRLYFDGLQLSSPVSRVRYNSLMCTQVNQEEFNSTVPDPDGCLARIVCEVETPINGGDDTSGGSVWHRGGTSLIDRVSIMNFLKASDIRTRAVPCRQPSGNQIRVRAEYTFVVLPSYRAAPKLYNDSYVRRPATTTMVFNEDLWIAMISLSGIAGATLLLTVWLYTREDFLTPYWDSDNLLPERCSVDPPLGIKAIPAFMFALSALGAIATLFAYYTIGATQTGTHWVVMEDFRGPQCGAGSAAWGPHHVACAPADNRCHRVSSFGTLEGTLYVRGTCAKDGTNIDMYATETMEQCTDVARAGESHRLSVPTGQCLPETEYLGHLRNSKDLQYIVFSCAEDELVQDTMRSLQYVSHGAAPTSADNTLQPQVTVPVETLTSDEVLFGKNTEAPFVYHRQWYNLSLPEFDDSELEETSVPLVVGNYTSASAPSLLEYSKVQYLSYGPNGTVTREDPRDPPEGPFYGVQFNRALQPAAAKKGVDTGARSYTAYDQVLRTTLSFQDTFRYAGLTETLFDIGTVVELEGNEDAAFTVSFWIQCSEQSVGFPLVLTDNWLENVTSTLSSTAAASPLISRLATIVMGGAPYSSFLEGDWNVYLAVAVDGQRQSLKVVSARGESGRVSEAVWTAENVPSLGRLFDGDWHFVALTSQLANNHRTIRLFLDCETSFEQQSWEQCLAAGYRIPPISTELSDENGNAFVFTAEDKVFDGGALFAGYFTGGLYNVRVHHGALEQERLIGLGTHGMRQYATISSMGSFALGTALGSFFVIFAGLSVYQFFSESAKSELSEDDRADAKDEAQGQAEEAAAAGNELVAGKAADIGGRTVNVLSSTRDSLAKLKAIAALFVGIVQTMALYLQGWHWPFAFEFYVGWAVAPFNFNFNLPALGVELNPMVSPLIQVVGVLLAFLALWFVVIHDKETFEDGLSNLETKLSEEADEEKTGEDHVAAHDHEFRVITPENGGPLDGKLLIWPSSRDIEVGSQFEKSLRYAWNKMVNDKLSSVVLPEKYRAVKEADDDDDSDDNSDDGSDGSTEEMKPLRHQQKNGSAAAAHNRLKEDTVVHTGSIEMVRNGTNTAGCELFFRSEGTKVGKRATGAPTKFPIEVTRTSDHEECPKHMLPLARAQDTEGLECASKLVPWAAERCCDRERAAQVYYVCRKKTCSFAVCETCSRMSSAQKEKAASLAIAKSLKSDEAPKFAYAFHTAATDKLAPLSLELTADPKENKEEAKCSSRNIGGRKGKQKDVRHNFITRSANGIEERVDRCCASLFPKSGQVIKQEACKVVGRPLADKDKKSSKNSSGGGSGAVQGTLVVYAIGGGENGAEYTLHFTANNSSNDSADVAPQRSSLGYCCPEHGVRLVPGRPEVHLTLAEHLDENGNPKFQCAEFLNRWGLGRCHGIDEDEPFYVCPHSSCTFAVCGDCGKLNSVQRAVAEVVGTLYAFGVGGAIGFVTLMVASALYFPTVQTALMVLTCHASFRCEFPGCYNDLTPEFIVTISGAIATTIIVGLGFILFLWHVTYQRKKHIIQEAGVIQGGFAGYKKDAVPEGFFQIFFADISADEWGTILDQDQTILRPLYDQFEFKHMCILPVFNLFKILLVMPIVFLPPNTLRQLIGAATVESLQLFFLCGSNAYVNPWIDTLSKTGSLHQLFQLSLMSFHRVLISKDPNTEGLSLYMIVGSCVYAVILMGVMLHVAIIPAIRGWIEKRRKRAEQRRQREEEIASRKQAVKEAHKQSGNTTASPSTGTTRSVEGLTEPFLSGEKSSGRAPTTAVAKNVPVAANRQSEKKADPPKASTSTARASQKNVERDSWDLPRSNDFDASSSCWSDFGDAEEGAPLASKSQPPAASPKNTPGKVKAAPPSSSIASPSRSSKKPAGDPPPIPSDDDEDLL